MTVGKVEGAPEPGDNRRRRTQGSRPRRSSSQGPIGFGSVMRDVRRSPDDPQRSSQPASAGFDPAALAAAQLDAGTAAARAMDSVVSTEDVLDDAVMGVEDAVEALAAQDRSITFQAQAQPMIPTNLGRMTPAMMLETVVDESTKLEIIEAMKELHLELEPADLGPVVVRIRKGPDGTLDIGFRTRAADTARMLESGSGLLRSRLDEAGLTTNDIDVQHDPNLQLVR